MNVRLNCQRCGRIFVVPPSIANRRKFCSVDCKSAAQSWQDDLAGQRFGRLTVIAKDNTTGRLHWVCLCDCGREARVRHDALLRDGGSRSCGCVRRVMPPIGVPARHGRTSAPEHAVWKGMISRCENPKNEKFADYGGRGITVCRRWRRSFVAFLNDMGPRPSPDHSIERKNNSGPYEPQNCVWATRSTQMNNTRRNRNICAFGRTQTMSEWSKETGIKVGTIWKRLGLGWPPEAAVSATVGGRG